MPGKTVRESRISMSQLMLPQDANPAGNVHGGVVMKLIDTTGGVVAMRHVRGNVVTASIDRLDFLTPVFVGDLVHVRASLNLVGSSSMEVGVRVETENIHTGELRHAVSAYLTYVALDENGKPMTAPALISETAEDLRRRDEAEQRRKVRLGERKKHRG
ncbi:uncharacterized protein (TIGR00369 family) [Desulfobaculum xiamenense]|uniref:Uncharacterized protein (TIGR00369 family) n=1 Tax=Desulfobaculum xiamenense TaxID=995050 RepID=A0A846QKP1_9BACT|nr:acyl-CoA thioesterase [Desulfobaculum xiamenense]NJB67727.1 uncharacterized protein (TIGR00369 family) [Desulfobaculum xiamenense]